MTPPLTPPRRPARARPPCRQGAGQRTSLSDKPYYLVGREAGQVDIVVNDPSVSRLHAAIVHHADGRTYLIDLQSVRRPGAAGAASGAGAEGRRWRRGLRARAPERGEWEGAGGQGGAVWRCVHRWSCTRPTPCNLPHLPLFSCSPCHVCARLPLQPGPSWVLQREGTSLNGDRIQTHRPTKLRSGYSLVFGASAPFTFTCEEMGAWPAAAQRSIVQQGLGVRSCACDCARPGKSLGERGAAG